MSAITRQMLKFKRMSNGQGRSAQLPNGGTIYDWDQAHFAFDITDRRFTRDDVDGKQIAAGATLRDVLPELADDRVVEHLRLTAAHWREARDVERDLAAETYSAIVAAVDSGVSEVQAAKIAGVDRMTVRRALGKL